MGDYFDDADAATPTEDITESRFIGVPKGYVGPKAQRRTMQMGGTWSRRGRITGTTVQQYAKGEELDITTWDSRKITQFQNMLRTVGSPFGMGRKTAFIPGMADPPTIAGYRRILGYANQQGMTQEEALMEIMQGAQQREEMGYGAEQRQPLTVRKSNPDELKALAETIAKATIGRGNLDPGFVDRMVRAYHQAEVEEQQAIYGAAESGGAVTKAPTPQTFIEQMVRQEDPQGAYEVDALDQLGEFGKLLRETGG